MSKYPFFLRSISLPLATVLGMALTMTAQTQLLGREAGHPVPWVRPDGFTQADGGNVFALTLKPPAAAPNRPRDVVILVSTAASQTGDYRAKSLATLQSALAKLNPDDRVKLVAFDLNTAPLTQGFVAADSPQMAAALNAINRRAPLGSCDLEKALDAAAKSFAGDSKSARVIVYLGDGSSRANILTADQLDRIVKDLVAQRTPVIAFGVGPQIDEQVLGILASRTGGLVVSEQARVDAGFYGARLAQAVHGSVFWPQAGGTVKWPDGMDVYPRVFPPMRSDRDTVVVGVMKSTAARQVEIDVDGPAGVEKLAWDIPELKSAASNAYLVTLVDQAKADGGRTLPLVDSASLAMAKQEIEAGNRGLAYWARQALEGGNLDSADKLASTALRRNPNDSEARAIKDAIAKKAGGAPVPVGAIAKAGEPGDLDLQGGQSGLPPPDGAAAMKEINESTALAEQWQRDVQNSINKARSLVMTDPAAAAVMIKNKTSDLTAMTELRPEIRDRLMGMLRTANREIKRRGEEFIHREQQRIREEMERREQEVTNEALQHEQRKLKQLMDRFNSLMAEGRHRLAEESAALEARKIADRSVPSAGPTMVAAANRARLTCAYTDITAVRVAAEKGFVDCTYQTELSHVAVPDDPPIVYQDGEAWKELTARRKDRFGAMELSHPSPAEKKIVEALKHPTQMEFIETPLKDAIEYLKELHHIEIQFDSAALKDAGVDELTPVTKNLKGISLRSALKLLLDDLQLKYVIHNEVLLITSPAKAEGEEFMITKVYPVTDIVLPIKQAGFSGGFGNLGGFGNFGGQNGNGIMNGSNQNGNGNPLANLFQNGNQNGNGNQIGNNLW